MNPALSLKGSPVSDIAVVSHGDSDHISGLFVFIRAENAHRFINIAWWGKRGRDLRSIGTAADRSRGKKHITCTREIR